MSRTVVGEKTVEFDVIDPIGALLDAQVFNVNRMIGTIFSIILLTAGASPSS